MGCNEIYISALYTFKFKRLIDEAIFFSIDATL